MVSEEERRELRLECAMRLGAPSEEIVRFAVLAAGSRKETVAPEFHEVAGAYSSRATA